MCEIYPEYLIFFFPSYLFIMASVIRYFALKNIVSSPKLIDQTRWLDDDDENYSPIKLKSNFFKKSPSLLLKISLSQIICFLYIIEFLIGFFLWEELFEIPCQKVFSLIYLVGGFSWFISASLLRKEYENELPQAFYTHRIFWMLSFLVRIFAFLLTKVKKIIIFCLYIFN